MGIRWAAPTWAVLVVVVALTACGVKGTYGGTHATYATDRVLDGQSAQARRAGLAFDVPQGWQAIDPAAALAAGASVSQSREALTSLAEGSGLSVEQLVQQLAETTDVVVVGPSVDASVRYITVSPRSWVYLPELPLITAELNISGATVDQVEHRTTALGPGLLVKAKLPEALGESETRQLFIQHRGHVSEIGVTASTSEEADRLVDQVLATLRPF